MSSNLYLVFSPERKGNRAGEGIGKENVKHVYLPI
jgi:hypothetical protein